MRWAAAIVLSWSCGGAPPAPAARADLPATPLGQSVACPAPAPRPRWHLGRSAPVASGRPLRGDAGTTRAGVRTAARRRRG
ncbi:MAG: hypothetical protein D6689_18870 [Deltaproteobacteria bacterium]|nr:MAG: hypothetical protein D6689_18870 [Deltaproteobacteria bacterium]